MRKQVFGKDCIYKFRNLTKILKLNYKKIQLNQLILFRVVLECMLLIKGLIICIKIILKVNEKFYKKLKRLDKKEI